MDGGGDAKRILDGEWDSVAKKANMATAATQEAPSNCMGAAHRFPETSGSFGFPCRFGQSSACRLESGSKTHHVVGRRRLQELWGADVDDRGWAFEHPRGALFQGLVVSWKVVSFMWTLLCAAGFSQLDIEGRNDPFRSPTDSDAYRDFNLD